MEWKLDSIFLNQQILSNFKGRLRHSVKIEHLLVFCILKLVLVERLN